MRSYHSYWNRFDQPDPYDGSYDLTDPQSLNRYTYVESDPVNFVDPTGLGGPGDHDNVVLTPCVLIDGVDTCRGAHIIPNAFSLSVFQVHGPEQNIFNVWLTPLLQQNPHQGFLPKTQAEKQKDYKDCLKNVSAIFTQAHRAIPNVFHNSLPSVGAVGRILLITALRAGGTAVFVGSISVSAAAPLVVSTVAVAYAGTWAGNVASNTVSNAAQRGKLLGEELKARIGCKAFLK